MKKTEVYPTVINGIRYTFIVEWMGSTWMAKARLGQGIVHVKGLDDSSSEEAALKLVKKLEL